LVSSVDAGSIIGRWVRRGKTVENFWNIVALVSDLLTIGRHYGADTFEG